MNLVHFPIQLTQLQDLPLQTPQDLPPQTPVETPPKYTVQLWSKLYYYLKRVVSNPIFLSLVSVVLIIYGITALALTYGPIIQVEAIYQYKTFLFQTFHVTSLRELILPTLKFDYQGQSSHRDFGLVIPAIYLNEPIIADVDPNDEAMYTQALKKGIAHAAGTANPGDVGIGYYFAHSSSPALKSQYNAVFYTLGKLKKADQIFVWKDQKKFTYSVTEIKETSPDDVSFLEGTPGAQSIVLQTCWPAGSTAKRLLVFAQLED